MTATSEQFGAMGHAARDLLRHAWARRPRLDILVTNGLIAVGKTFASDPSASAALLRQAIDPGHMREHGYKELSWLARNIRTIAQSDPEFAAEIYGAAYGHTEDSDDATNMGGSVLLALRSNRRQDYQSTWFQLSEALPGVLDDSLEAGVRALARGLDAYVTRAHAHDAMPGEPDRASFPLDEHAANFRQDWSHSWYRGGFRSPNDGPALLSKFDAYLQRLATDDNAKAKTQRVIIALAQQPSVPAAVWASLLDAGSQSPGLYADLLYPLAVAAPIMQSSDTRHSLGVFVAGAYSHWSETARAGLESAILALDGERVERHKASLAGAIPNALIATAEMRGYIAELERAGKARPNVPPMQYTSTVRPFDTDAYLESEGVSLEEPDSAALRAVLGEVEALATPGATPDLSLPSLRRQIAVLLRLHLALSKRFAGKVPDALFEHATGKLAEAASRLAHASPSVLKAIKAPLKRILLFCAASANPHYDAKHAANFHEHLSWGGPSARTSAAQGLMDLTRAERKRDSRIMAAIRKLARDRVPEVRLQIVQNLAMLGTLDAGFAWSEVDYALRKEPTRGVVAGAITALCRLSHQDVPRAIRLAKGLIKRYGNKNAPGMAICRGHAKTFIFDIHIYQDNSEADAFAAAVTADILHNAENIRQLVARYSDTLLRGDLQNSEALDNGPRRRTLAFYDAVTRTAFSDIQQRADRLDIQNFGNWPQDDQEAVRELYGVLDEVSLRLHFAAGTHYDGSAPEENVSPERARLYWEIKPLLTRLTSAVVAPVAHHLIQGLEVFVPLDPGGAFSMIAQSVKSAEQGGYSNESMAADLIVRIVKRYIADYRAVFSDRARLDDLMDCLDVFVRAGWPQAQSLTFRLGEIWR
jgi:hypothetical protein